MNPEVKELNQIEAYNKATKELNELYKTENGKKFIHHLIYAFKSGNLYHIIYTKKIIFDCITRSKLNPIFIDRKDIPDDIRLLNSNLVGIEDEEGRKSILLNIETLAKEYIKSNQIKRLAIKSDLTNKILGSDELTALDDFIKDRKDKNDETIIKMIKFINYNKNHGLNKDNHQRKVDKRKTLSSDNELRNKLLNAIK